MAAKYMMACGAAHSLGALRLFGTFSEWLELLVFSIMERKLPVASLSNHGASNKSSKSVEMAANAVTSFFLTGMLMPNLTMLGLLFLIMTMVLIKRLKAILRLLVIQTVAKFKLELAPSLVL